MLVPIVERPAGLSLLLTRRSDQLRDHPGQVSFPGGRIEPEDGGPIAAALREAAEELGIEARRVAVAGNLPVQAIVTGYVVTPVVGFVPSDLVLRPDAAEVAEAFEVPLSFFLDPGNLQVTVRKARGIEMPTFEYHYAGQCIWGATARMIRVLIRAMNANG